MSAPSNLPTCAVCYTPLVRRDQPCPHCGRRPIGSAESTPPNRCRPISPTSRRTKRGKIGRCGKRNSPAAARAIWQAILDPRSIHGLLGLGGALLVVGLVIWLATLGVFKNATVVAVTLGLSNAVLLGAGWWITSRSPYRTAGRSLTLLSCLVMPLNLWFYHSHGLITLSGHLWAAALVCCVLYAASAMILRDPAFVYVLCGGVAMTGLLMLADMGHFWESPPRHTACRPGNNLRSRGALRGFGRAIFAVAIRTSVSSGRATRAGLGLLLLLVAEVAGDWLYPSLFEPIYQHWQLRPAVMVTEPWGRLLALGLVLAGTYVYAYSDLVVRRIGVYICLAVFSLLWAEILTINLLALTVTAEAAILALALTALLSHTFRPRPSAGRTF